MGLRNKRGQATTEIAIFGSLILVCFAVLLSYSQNLNEQQALQQQAFRMALRRAYEDNGFVSYSILKNPRTVNIFGGFKEEYRGSSPAGASVLWAMGEVENFAYYQINEDLIDLTPYKIGSGEDEELPQVWDIEFEADTDYQATDVKDENYSQIATTRSSQLTDTITTRLKTKYDSGDGPTIERTQGLDSDSRYRQSAVGTTVTRSRRWTTPH